MGSLRAIRCRASGGVRAMRLGVVQREAGAARRGCLGPGLIWHSKAGAEWPARLGKAEPGSLGQSESRQGRHGGAWRAAAVPGLAGRVLAWLVRQAAPRQSTAWRDRAGHRRCGEARTGLARQDGAGVAWLSEVQRAGARRDMAGKARWTPARWGQAWHGAAGLAVFGVVWPGACVARPGRRGCVGCGAVASSTAERGTVRPAFEAAP